MNDRNQNSYDGNNSARLFLDRCASTFAHPDEVTSDPTLTVAEKRAILASWVSDARAVQDAPQLRQLDSGAVVGVEDVLRALRSLDDAGQLNPLEPRWHMPLHQRKGVLVKWLRKAARLHGSNDNDNDPPPCPAGIAVPYRPTFVAAYGERAANTKATGGGRISAALAG